MSDPPHEGDDPFSILETMRARLEADARRERVQRQPERRISERREPDHELNAKLREFLSKYLRQLPDEKLWLWIDGLWLGTATTAQLMVLFDAVLASEEVMLEQLAEPATTDDQIMPDVPPLLHKAVRYEWRSLRAQLAGFCEARRHHHARTNRLRNGQPRSQGFRTECLASPIGHRIDQVGLFAEFFDAPRSRAVPHPTPAAMAAKLLHRERQQLLIAQFAHAHAHAAKDPSDNGREWWTTRATQAAAHLRDLPSWQTLHRKLKKRKK